MDIELFMFKVMTALYNMNAPIVFKGAMVLKAIQYKTGNPSGLERGTKDIDGDWCGNPPTMSFLQKSLQQAVYTAGYSTVSVVATREYGKGKSAGFNFVYNNEVIAKIDLSIRNNPFGYNFAFSNGLYLQDSI